MLPYIAAPWILWVLSSDSFYSYSVERNDRTLLDLACPQIAARKVLQIIRPSVFLCRSFLQSLVTEKVAMQIHAVLKFV